MFVCGGDWHLWCLSVKFISDISYPSFSFSTFHGTLESLFFTINLQHSAHWLLLMNSLSIRVIFHNLEILATVLFCSLQLRDLYELSMCIIISSLMQHGWWSFVFEQKKNTYIKSFSFLCSSSMLWSYYWIYTCIESRKCSSFLLTLQQTFSSIPHLVKYKKLKAKRAAKSVSLWW